MSGKRGIHAKTAGLPELVRSLGRQRDQLLAENDTLEAQVLRLRARVAELEADLDRLRSSLGDQSVKASREIG